MTVEPEADIDASVATRATRRTGRLIAVGVRDNDYDAAVLQWAQYDAEPGIDVVHVVHAYIPEHLAAADEATAYQLDGRFVRGERVLAAAVQFLRDACPGLPVEGSAIPGLPEDVLHEFTSVADLLVIGESIDAAVRRNIAHRMQDHAHCPVVTVPHAYRPPSAPQPVTLLAAGATPRAVLRFAAQAAQRYRVDLRVVRDDGSGNWCDAVGGGLLVNGAGTAERVRRAVAEGRFDAPIAVVPAE
jgi:hypothetical protein